MAENILESNYSINSEIQQPLYPKTYIKKKISTNHSIINIPHVSKMSNKKSEKYFSSECQSNIITEALKNYNQKPKINNNSLNSVNTNTTSNYDIKNEQKTESNKNQGLIINKNLIQFAEPRSTIKKSYKLKPKILEDIDSDSDNDGIGENLIIYNKNKSNFSVGLSDKPTLEIEQNDKVLNKSILKNNNSINKEHAYRHIKNNLNQVLKNAKVNILNSNSGTTIKNKKNTNKNNKNKLECNDLKLKNKKDRLNTTDISQIEIKIPSNLNFKYLVLLNELFDDLVKDIDMNKVNNFSNKISIIDDFFNLFNDKDMKVIFDIFDVEYCTIKNSTQRLCKEYFILLTIFLYLLIIIYYINNGKEKDNFLSGIKNICFYFHQNLYALIFTIFQYNEENINMYNEENKINHTKCLSIIDNNLSWLNKNNYKKTLSTNNKVSKNILRNIVQLINTYFRSNNIQQILSDEKFTLGITRAKLTIKDIDILDIESSLNLIKYHIKCIQKVQLHINQVQKTLSENNTLKFLFNISKEITQIDQLSALNSPDTNLKENSNSPQSPLNQPQSVPYPYLPSRNDSQFSSKYTLILDLDETLVHYIEDNESAYVQIRPGCEEFISEMSKYFELIIFTAALQSYANIVIDGIDTENKISYRLFRQHTLPIGKVYIKDLSKLGRELKWTIIIDNCKDVFSLQPANGINIKNFEGDENDTELFYLMEKLVQIVKDNPDDVRKHIEGIQKEMNERYQMVNLNVSEINNEGEEGENLMSTLSKFNFLEDNIKDSENVKGDYKGEENEGNEENVEDNSEDEQLKINIK